MLRSVLASLFLLAACTSQTGPSTTPPTAPEDDPVGGGVVTPRETSTAWKEGAAVDVAEGLTVTVRTSATCCVEGEVPADRSPARFFLALVASSGAEGYVLFLDRDDAVVLAGQDAPGSYTVELYRGEGDAKASRTGGVVTMTVPPSGLPTGPLLIWAGTRSSSTVGGTPLPVKAEDGSIPTIRLTGPNDVAAAGAPVTRGAEGQLPPDPEGRPPEGEPPGDVEQPDFEPPTGAGEAPPVDEDTPPPDEPPPGDEDEAPPPEGED